MGAFFQFTQIHPTDGGGNFTSKDILKGASMTSVLKRYKSIRCKIGRLARLLKHHLSLKSSFITYFFMY